MFQSSVECEKVKMSQLKIIESHNVENKKNTNADENK